MMNHKTAILVIEDDAGLRMTLCDRLSAESYECTAVADGTEGFNTAKAGHFDILILDLMLPGKSGFDICRDLRASGFSVPILMLTARDQIIDRVLGLKLGADDYLCKPFDMAELLARIEALLRRAAAAEPALKEQNATKAQQLPPVQDYGNFQVDFSRGMVSHNGREQLLSAQEYKLLSYLCSRPGEIIKRDRLLDEVWAYGTETSTRTVDVHIAWLRKKIGDSGLVPRHIQTVRGLGYRFIP